MHGWGYDIEMDLKEIVLDSVGWIHVAQARNGWWAVVEVVRVFSGWLSDC
jgi:uncharacterized membrane protein YdcZ (DUF606 family)